MIITLTSFALRDPVTTEEAGRIFQSTAPKYREVPGLVSKHYVVSEGGRAVGGIYMWKTRADAEAMYTEAWREFVRGKYGTEPQVTYYECPLVVDNVANKIVTNP